MSMNSEQLPRSSVKVPERIKVQRHVDEIIACGKDPKYFINTYVRIEHPTRGIIPLKSYMFQERCVNDFVANRFNIVVKSRQLGISSITAAYALWLALFYRGKNILVIATKLDTAMNFIRKVKTALSGLPRWLVLPDVNVDNKQSIEFSNGSKIKAIPTSADAGRSEALSLLIVDEAAFIRNFDELWAGLYPTLSLGGRAIIISTPNGVGDLYHDLYTRAEAGHNEFNAIKLMWTEHPEHDQAWFDNETRNMSARDIAQEMMCDFASSGQTMVSAEDIEHYSKSTCRPIDRRGFDSNFWVWDYPLTEHKYIMSADVARGDASDFSAAHVLDVDTAEIVAEYQGKLPPDRFAEFLDEMGRWYNRALLCPENNTYGYATIIRLKELRYPNLYHDPRHRDPIAEAYMPDDSKPVGIFMDAKMRPIVLRKLEEVLRNREIVVKSTRLYNELKTFIWRRGRPVAQAGKNDDLVMSMAICMWLWDTLPERASRGSYLSDVILRHIGVMRRDIDAMEGSGRDVVPVTHHMQPIEVTSEWRPGMRRSLLFCQLKKELEWLL